ncbi:MULTISPECIES: DUF3239 domain-containing protein [unclassified Psychrobacter]|uniref:DUF3239 domain-containing protein n=1 Tax=unclassified Psychrobacter TaxID=196806 RepID=UPI003FD1CA30
MKNNFTVDNDTVASNPSNAELKKRVWFRHNKIVVGSLLLFVVWSLLATVIIDIVYLFVIVVAVIINVYYWTNKKEHFLSGHSNGGIVVGTYPTLVAVNGDLSKGYGYFPVIKITKRNSLKNVNIGDRIPTVALYTASSDEFLSHWINFNPIPLSYATDDPKVLEQAMQSYPNEQWEQLENYLLNLEKPYKVGLYQVEKEHSSWNEVSNDSLNVLNRLELEEGHEGINLTKIIISVVVFIAILKAVEFFV